MPMDPEISDGGTTHRPALSAETSCSEHCRTLPSSKWYHLHSMTVDLPDLNPTLLSNMAAVRAILRRPAEGYIVASQNMGWLIEVATNTGLLPYIGGPFCGALMIRALLYIGPLIVGNSHSEAGTATEGTDVLRQGSEVVNLGGPSSVQVLPQMYHNML